MTAAVPKVPILPVTIREESTDLDHQNCCGRTDGAGCVCATEAKCSCGKQAAMHCNCEKAATENKVPSDACACGMFRSQEFVAPYSSQYTDYELGMRPKGACTCNSTAMGSSANEIDFTGKA